MTSEVLTPISQIVVKFAVPSAGKPDSMGAYSRTPRLRAKQGVKLGERMW